MPWQDYYTRPLRTRAVQYNPPEEALPDLVFDNGANQKLIWVRDRVPDYVAPGDWIVDIPGGYEILKDAAFRAKYVPGTGTWDADQSV